MGLKETFQIVIDVTNEGAKKSLKDLGAEVNNTEGTFNKLKVAGSGAATFVDQHFTAFAAGAGAAIAGFAVKSVMNFEELGLAVDKFSTATGTSTETASRWVEVAKDLGLSSDDVQSSMGKLEKQLGKNADSFSKYGLEVTRTKDGQIDASATYLNAIQLLQSTTDATKRAEIGAALFGKSWQSVAPLVSQGASDIAKRLGEVDKAKIFDSSKVASAKDLRDAFDSLKDSAEEIGLTFGSQLAPAFAASSKAAADLLNSVKPITAALGDALAKNAEFASTVVEKLTGSTAGLGKAMVVAEPFLKLWSWEADKATGIIGNLSDITAKGTDKIDAAAESMKAAGHSAQGYGKGLVDYVANGSRTASEDLAAMYEAADRAGRGLGTMAQSADDTRAAVARVDDEWKTLTGDLDRQQSALDLSKAFDDVATKAAAATDAIKHHRSDSKQALEDQAQAMLDLKKKVADYAQQTGDIPPQVVQRIFAEIDAGAFDQAAQDIANLTQTRPVVLQPRVGQVSRFAKGTDNAPGGVALVGEEGPELVDLPAGSRVIPAPQTAAMLGDQPAGVTEMHFHAHLNVQSLTGGLDTRSTRMILNALETEFRRSGPRWVTVRAG